jgi:hypothetical protein
MSMLSFPVSDNGFKSMCMSDVSSQACRPKVGVLSMIPECGCCGQIAFARRWHACFTAILGMNDMLGPASMSIGRDPCAGSLGPA